MKKKVERDEHYKKISCMHNLLNESTRGRVCVCVCVSECKRVHSDMNTVFELANVFGVWFVACIRSKFTAKILRKRECYESEMRIGACVKNE